MSYMCVSRCVCWLGVENRELVSVSASVLASLSLLVSSVLAPNSESNGSDPSSSDARKLIASLDGGWG